jgi:hypothetical protein
VICYPNSRHSGKKAIHLDRDRGRAQILAAAAIRAVLARKSQRIDLIKIASAIIASIRSVQIGD